MSRSTIDIMLLTGVPIVAVLGLVVGLLVVLG